MAIRVQCKSCQAQFAARDELAGKQGKCPKCSAPIRVPTPKPAIGQPPGRSASPQRFAASPSRATGRAAVAEQLLSGFRGDIRRVRASLIYRFGILLTAAVMVLLPIAYVALIGLTGMAVCYHAVHNTWVAGAGVGRGRLISVSAYLAPIVAGVILLFFMLKPFFARPSVSGRTRSLTRQGEPILFSFVDRICKAVGARQPVRIEVDSDVNASAGLDGAAFTLLRNRLVLRIGVPLAAGMNTSQLAGVLAHEFGHFTQGAGLRLTFLIGSINRWFVRVVYARDAWDEWLEETANDLDFRIGWILQLSRIAVYLSRRILWVFMVVGHVVSSFMSRQMEYHADAHQARLVGGTVFDSTHRQLGRLALAYQAALGDMEQFVDRGCFADDLPQLMLANAAAFPPELLHAIDESRTATKTGWFDTHPAPRDRIRRAAIEGKEPVFADDRPAAELFTDFKALSRGVTWDLYRACFGSRFQPSKMRPTEELLLACEQRPNEPPREIAID